MSIYKAHGGTVYNSGTINGYYYGIKITGGIGTVTNTGRIAAINDLVSVGAGVQLDDGGAVYNAKSGYIFGHGYGVLLSDGGTIMNDSGATIDSGFESIKVSGAAGTISNSGTIGDGIYLEKGGSVTNCGSGLIENFFGSGIAVFGASGTIKNDATIAAKTLTTFYDGIRLTDGGTVTNAKGGTISGYNGIIIGGGGSVTNAATITGKKDAVQFTGSGVNTLTLQTGSVLTGAVVGSTTTGATNALVLEDSGTANNIFSNFNTLTVEASGTWTLGGASTIAKKTVTSGTLDLTAAATGTATDTISGASTLEFGASVAVGQTIDFTGADGLLDLGSPTSFSGVISGFDTIGSNDSVELLGSWTISGYTQTATQGTLALKDGTETASLVFDGTYTKSLFDPVITGGDTTITYT